MTAQRMQERQPDQDLYRPLRAMKGDSVGGKLAKEICDGFELKHVSELKIHMVSNGLFTLEAKMFMDNDGARQLTEVLKKFKLVPIEDETHK